MWNRSSKAITEAHDAPIELSLDQIELVSGGLKIEGVDGESMDDKKRGTIEIMSFSTSSSSTSSHQ